MQIGEEYMVTPECALPDRKVRKRVVKGQTIVEKIPMKGKVVYVHPAERYATLEFEGVYGNPRECFFPEKLTEKNSVQKKGK